MKLKNCVAGDRLCAKDDISIRQSDVIFGHRSIKENAKYLFSANRFATIVSVEDSDILVKAYGVTFRTDPHLWRKVVDNPVA